MKRKRTYEDKKVVAFRLHMFTNGGKNGSKQRQGKARQTQYCLVKAFFLGGTLGSDKADKSRL